MIDWFVWLVIWRTWLAQFHRFKKINILNNLFVFCYADVAIVNVISITNYIRLKKSLLNFFLKHCLFSSLMKRWAKRTYSITYGQSVKLLSSTFIIGFLIVVFCLSSRPFAFGWYALVTRWMMPVRRCSSAETLFINSRPWSLICMEKQSSCKLAHIKTVKLSLPFYL